MVRIIDASVAIKWFVIEDGREQALTLFEEVLNTPRSFAVPELFYFELANVFNKLFPKPTLDLLELFQSVLHLGIQRFSMSGELFIAIGKYQTLGLSGYDSAYVALAEIVGGIWITADTKAHKLIKHLKLSQLLQ